MSLRTKAAVGLTAIYICGFVLVAALRSHELVALPLNELGDFLAGAFGPLALAWLVFGYFQQGDELRQGTEALRLQAAELNASVNQQVEMVRAQKLALENHERAIEPILMIDYKSSVRIDGFGFDNFSISNKGEYCEGLVLSFTQATGELFELDLQPLHKNADSNFSLEESLSHSTLVSVRYRRMSGKIGEQKFYFTKYHDGGEEFLTVRKALS